MSSGFSGFHPPAKNMLVGWTGDDKLLQGVNEHLHEALPPPTPLPTPTTIQGVFLKR